LITPLEFSGLGLWLPQQLNLGNDLLIKVLSISVAGEAKRRHCLNTKNGVKWSYILK